MIRIETLTEKSKYGLLDLSESTKKTIILLGKLQPNSVIREMPLSCVDLNVPLKVS